MGTFPICSCNDCISYFVNYILIQRINTVNLLFRIYALLFLISALYHLIGLIYPEMLVPVPLWRHLLFLIINMLSIVLILNRMKWSLYYFIILTVQQVYSHSNRMYDFWVLENKFDTISFIIILVLPPLNILLYHDQKRLK